MTYSRSEQETSIIWDEEEKVAHIYTASPVSMRKLDRLCEAYPVEYKRTWTETDGDGCVTAAKYETSCKRVKFGKPASESRVIANRRNAAKIASRT